VIPGDRCPAVEARSLTVRSADGARALLDDVSFSWPPGSRVAVVGANGSGKSTLLRTLAGVESPSGGTLTIPGRVGLLVQDPDVAWISGSVAEEVEAALRWVGADRGTDPRRVIEDLGLAALAGRDPLTLSGGEQQRVQLAAVLVARPDVLLLDEPVAFLDPASAAEVRAAWRAHLPPEATRVEAVTDPETALDADRWLVLAGGRVVADAAPRALLDPDHWARWGLPVPARIRVARALGAPLTTSWDGLRGLA